MNDLKVSVIIPAFNEALTIGGLVDAIKTRHPGYEVIVINDGSRDDTAGVAIAAGATVYSHPYNIGNGAAIKSGIRIASGEIMIFMDGEQTKNRKSLYRGFIQSNPSRWVSKASRPFLTNRINTSKIN